MNRLIFRISLIAAYFAIVLSLISCNTERKAIKYLDKHPEYCAKKYPIVEKVDTLIKVETDSSLLNQYEQEFANLWQILDSCASVKKIDTVKVSSIKRIMVPKLRTVTVNKIQESTAKVEACLKQMEELERDYELNVKGFENELNEAEKRESDLSDKLAKAKRQRNRFMWWLIAMGIFAFRRQIVKLFL